MSELLIIETKIEESSTAEFLKIWIDDIENIFPHFDEEEIDYSSLYILKYQGKNAGIFIYERKGEELHIHVDYVIPEFRDIGIGKAFFKQKINDFKASGFALLVALTNCHEHIQYLKSLGFVLSNKHPDRYELLLN